MSDPISRAEHEEFVKRMEDENKRQNKRIESLELIVKEIGALTASVQKLAVNMENMLKVQGQQGERLEVLESRDGEMWRKVTGYIVTTVIGLVVGYIGTKIGM